MKRFLPILFLLCALGARAADTYIQMTNWNTDISAGANRDVFVKPLLYSNNFPVSPIDTRKYTSDSTSAFYISNQLSGYYQLDIQAPPQTRRLWLRVKDVSGKWTPTLLDFDFQNLSVPPNAYTRDQTDAAIRNATNGLSGGSYTNSATLWVDRNGGAGIRGVQGSPYATLSNALAAALAGDTIIVNAGRYTNNNLLKPGVNWYFAPGSVVWYQQPTTNDAGWGIFDDRTSGATTNYITGFGDFWFLKGTNGSGTGGAYLYNLNTRGLLVVTNHLSEVHFQANRVYHAGVDGIATAALDLEDYQRMFVDIEEIYDPWLGLTITLKDTSDGTDDYTSNASGVTWGVGSEGHVRVGRITVSQYGLWGSDSLTQDPGNHNKACNFWFTGDFVGSKLYINCVSTNYRSWFNIKELTSGNPTSIYGSGRHYLEFEKLEATAAGQPALDLNGNYGGGSNVVVWLNAQKVSSRGQWIGYLGGAQGQLSTIYAAVQHWEDLGTISTGFVASATTEIHLIGGYAKLNSGVGIRHDGGNTFVDGLTIDNSSGSKAGIEVAGSGLQLKGVRLIAPVSTNSISAPSAQTVQVSSSSSGNRLVNANVTLSPNAGFEVDTTGQITGVATESVHATNADNVTLATRATIATNTIGPLAYDSSTGAYTNGAGTTVLSAGLVNGSAVSGTVTLAATALAVDGSGITGQYIASPVSAESPIAGGFLTTNGNKIVPSHNANGFTNMNAAKLTGGPVTNAVSGPVSGDISAATGLTSNQIPNLDASKLVTGTIAVAQLPALASAYPAAVTNNDTRALTMVGSINSTNGFKSGTNNVAMVVAVVDVTNAASGSIGTTTIFTAPSSGMFDADIQLSSTVAGSAGTVTETLSWTDDIGATSATSATCSLSAQARVNPNVVGRFITSGSIITYATTVSGATGSPTYAVHIRIIWKP